MSTRLKLASRQVKGSGLQSIQNLGILLTPTLILSLHTLPTPRTDSKRPFTLLGLTRIVLVIQKVCKLSKECLKHERCQPLKQWITMQTSGLNVVLINKRSCKGQPYQPSSDLNINIILCIPSWAWPTPAKKKSEGWPRPSNAYRISSISFRPRIVFAALVTVSELILALE